MRRARAAALLMLALPGGAYVYQGEELGLPQVTDLPDEVLQDPTFFRTGGAERGRGRLPGAAAVVGDGAAVRVRARRGRGRGCRSRRSGPADRRAAGRRPGVDARLYRAALALRRDGAELGDGPMRWIDADGTCSPSAAARGSPAWSTWATSRRRLPDAVRDGPVLLASGPLPDDGRLPGATSAWYAV